jgi:hypothetical protein
VFLSLQHLQHRVFIIRLSILQNGKVPQFIPENILHAIFSENEVSPAITNLREGFVKTGLYQVCVVSF